MLFTLLSGLKAIYLSGWQVAADANTALQTYPDQSLYPCDSVPKVRVGGLLPRGVHSSPIGLWVPFLLARCCKWVFQRASDDVDINDAPPVALQSIRAPNTCANQYAWDKPNDTSPATLIQQRVPVSSALLCSFLLWSLILSTAIHVTHPTGRAAHQ
eukprot:1144156-Pelagomonas_calceolata.AAC.5